MLDWQIRPLPDSNPRMEKTDEAQIGYELKGYALFRILDAVCDVAVLA